MSRKVDWADYASDFGQSCYHIISLGWGCYRLCSTPRDWKNMTNTTSHWCRNLMTVLLIKFTETHFIIYIKHTALPRLVTVRALLYPYLFTKYRYRIDIAIFCQYRIDIVSKLKFWCWFITTVKSVQEKWRTKMSWRRIKQKKFFIFRYIGIYGDLCDFSTSLCVLVLFYVLREYVYHWVENGFSEVWGRARNTRLRTAVDAYKMRKCELGRV